MNGIANRLWGLIAERVKVSGRALIWNRTPPPWNWQMRAAMTRHVRSRAQPSIYDPGEQ